MGGYKMKKKIEQEDGDIEVKGKGVIQATE